MGGILPIKKCTPNRHKFVFKYNHSFYQGNGRNGIKFVSQDFFFCEKCLWEETTTKDFYGDAEDTYGWPEWCRTITTKANE